MRRSHLLVLGAALLSGCASAERPAREEQGGLEDKAPAPPQPNEEPRAGGPHDKVPGGPEQAAPAAPAVRFKEPAAPPTPVALERRPGLPERVELAVAAVENGLLLPAEALILRVDAELSYEEEIDIVTGPGGQPEPPEIDLAGLARIAMRAGHHLLLVDVRPSRRQSGLRDGYLLHAPTGAVLAAWTVAEGEQRPTGGGADDLVARIARAHQRIGSQ